MYPKLMILYNICKALAFIINSTDEQGKSYQGHLPFQEDVTRSGGRHLPFQEDVTRSGGKKLR